MSTQFPNRRAALLLGIKEMLPIQLGMVPFGLIAGVTATAVGWTPFQGSAMSVIVLAGSAQLVALQLVGMNSPLFVIYLSTFFINLRFLMYSMAIADHFRHLPLRWKLLNAYLLTDQAFAFSILKYNDEGITQHRRWYYLGSAMTLWTTWQICTLVGVLVGSQIPPAWSLDFAVALTFIALVIPNIRDKATAVAAVTAGIIAVAGKGLPYNLGLILAALAGITIGVFVENQLKQPVREPNL
jgi:4-azaleucine resistance transporter AzlC